jgi:hypothetical protein
MREPCGQSVYAPCDRSTCDRQCSASIIIREQNKASLAAVILPAAIAALGLLAFIAAADVGLSRQERAVQTEARV